MSTNSKPKALALYQPHKIVRVEVDSSKWVSCTDRLPPQDTEVETKIDDEHGKRNSAVLKRHGRLWFFPDMSMYIYYEPTHWRKV